MRYLFIAMCMVSCGSSNIQSSIARAEASAKIEADAKAREIERFDIQTCIQDYIYDNMIPAAIKDKINVGIIIKESSFFENNNISLAKVEIAFIKKDKTILRKLNIWFFMTKYESGWKVHDGVMTVGIQQ